MTLLPRFRLPGFFGTLAFLALSAGTISTVQAVDKWTVTIRLHEATAKTHDDASGEEDIFWHVSLVPTVGTGDAATCSTEEHHDDDHDHIEPADWACTLSVTGGTNTRVLINLELMEHDTTSDNDIFDINPDPNVTNLLMNFQPASSLLAITGVPGWENPQCAFGRIKQRGVDGDDQAEVIFSVSASLVGAPNGDTDGDGLADTWEVCGIDADSDGTADVNLAAMGADPYRKDIFTEIDWMADATHTHAPWLPALRAAWLELNGAPVTNPTVNGTTNLNGIALHVDTGLLYSSYNLDFNNNGSNEFAVPADGNYDVNGDGIVDIGNLAALYGGPVGGNALTELNSMDGNEPPGGPFNTNTFFGPASDFGQIKAANFQAARAFAFHYVIFGHQYPSLQYGAANNRSSGIANPCNASNQGRCADFLVALGTRNNEMLDTTGPALAPDGVPEAFAAAGPFLLGPGGLPVPGSVRQHLGTFLHELGHTLGLGHGGGDGINNKPNYLSIMSYARQMPGVGFDTAPPAGTADPVSVDFDGNGFQDVTRYLYSGAAGLTPPLGALNEGVAPGPFLDETVALDPGNALTNYSCPVPASGGSPRAPLVNTNAPIDWNCDNNNQASVSADVNNRNNSSGVIQNLPGFDDYLRLQANGLGFSRALPGITLDEEIENLSTEVRIIELNQESGLTDVCRSTKDLNFEGIPAGTQMGGHYEPYATFLSDAQRDAIVMSGPDRNYVPTFTRDNSLASIPRRDTASLIINFPTPIRAFTLRYGQAGFAQVPEEGARAVFRAWDVDGLPMGQIVRPLGPAQWGITQFMGAVTVWPDQFMSRLEVSYEADVDYKTVQLREPPQIDSLLVCRLPKKTLENPIDPPTIISTWGKTQVHLTVASANTVQVPGSEAEAGHTAGSVVAFSGLPVQVSGASMTTDGIIVRPEGSSVTLWAPGDYRGGKFLYWKHSSGIAFGLGMNEVPLTLLADGKVTAVYQNADVTAVTP